MNVDKTKVDVTIGRTAIHGDKPVQLAWNKDQQNMTPLKEEPSEFDITKIITSRSAKSHRQAAMGHRVSLCVQCCRMVDSVPIRHIFSIL